MTPDISDEGYIKCIQALLVLCNNFKENVAFMGSNGNKSMLHVRSANNHSYIAVINVGEGNIGQKTHLIVLQKLIHKA